MINLADGRRKRLDDIDLPKIGAQIGVGEDRLHAVIDVESRGVGYTSSGQLIALFEPHIFYRQLRHKPAARQKAVAAGLAHPYNAAKNRRSYNKNQQSVIKRAMAIDEEAALKSCSFGMFQIMGFNHKSAGYATVQDMVVAFLDDEENHLQAAVNFIKNNNLDDELRRKDWKGFARGYNGPGYARNRYDVKLARAYAKWSRIRDTPYNPEDHPVEVPDELVDSLDKSSFDGRMSKNVTATGVAAVASQAGPILDIAERATGLPLEMPDWMGPVLGVLFVGAIGFLIWDRFKISNKAKAGLSKLKNTPGLAIGRR